MKRWEPLATLVFPLLTVVSLGQNDYWQNVWLSIMLFTLLSVSWNLLAGFTGYISFGHAAFFAIGAYTTGILASPPVWLRLMAAGSFASVGSFLFAFPSLRIRGFVFAMVTLGMAEILHVVTLHGGSLTGGPQGMGVLFGGSQADVLVWAGTATSLVVFGALILPWTSFGRRLVALRGDELTAAALGINVSACKFVMFLLSAFTTGLAGALYALWLRFLEPSDVYSTTRLVAVLAANVFGGMIVPLGPVVGAVLMGALQEFTWVTSPFLHQVVFGLVILGFALWLPQGVLGTMYERQTARIAALVRKSSYDALGDDPYRFPADRLPSVDPPSAGGSLD